MLLRLLLHIRAGLVRHLDDDMRTLLDLPARDRAHHATRASSETGSDSVMDRVPAAQSLTAQVRSSQVLNCKQLSIAAELQGACGS